MKNAFALLLSTMLAFPVWAQPTQTAQTVQPEIVIQRISYVPSPPRSVLKMMPRGARNCFYGSFHTSPKAPALWVHLFDPKPSDKAEGYFGTYHLRLNIFESHFGRTGATPTLRLLNTVGVDYRSEIDRPSRFNAQFLWLAPKTKQQPIIKFDCFDPAGIYGDIGDNVLVVFSKGLKRKPVVQSLAFGSWNASDSSGQDTKIENLDKNGLLELHTALHPAGDYPPTKWVLNWNGKQFYPVGGPIKGEGFPPGLPYP